MLVDVVERPGLEDGLKVERLVGDQVAERHPDARQRRLVERDQRVAERDDEQQLGELEHRIAQPVSREHHLDAVPRDDDRGEREEQAMSEAEELRLVRQQQSRDCLLDRRKQIEFHEQSLRNRPTAVATF